MTAVAPRPPAKVVALGEVRSARFARESSDGLFHHLPDLSAKHTFSRRQLAFAAATTVVVVLALAFQPEPTLTVLIAVAVLTYVVILGYRVSLFRRSLHAETITVSDEEARSIPNKQLPCYTILVPAYNEAEVIAETIERIMAIEYPAYKLDVKLLVEAEDRQTIDAILDAAPPPCVSVVVVPPIGPRTKPKALNYGLRIARGELVAVYDAEDRPEPLQLRRAAAVFSRAAGEIACLQASLSYYNKEQNILTKWFQGEYLNWFHFLLPGLAAGGIPVPLGGTSNHLRRSVLDDIGGWDAFNVTEDADLGIRLHRLGHRSAVLDSVTYEEATSDYVNWARQRSRWHKGYMQTWLVHMRHPRRLLKELGWRGFIGFNLFVGGTPLLGLLNPLFWALAALWFVAHPPQVEALFPWPIYYPAMVCWLVGNAMIIYLNLVTVRLANDPPLAVAALLSPLYWVAISISTYKAAWQLVTNPVHWEKTVHGMTDLMRKPEAESVAG